MSAEVVSKTPVSAAPRPSTTAFRRLAWTAAAATLALVTLGGVVRITGSGMGCGDDWPLCRGRLVPPFELPTLIEYGHRLAAAGVSALVAALLILAWTRHQRDPRLRGPATLAGGLLAVQVLLGAVTVWLHLPAGTVVLHLIVGMLLLATLTAAALESGLPRPGTGTGHGDRGATQLGESRVASSPVAAARLRRLARGSAALALATVALGGLVANLDAGPACVGFPLCNGSAFPAGEPRVFLQGTHRLLAFTLVALLGWVWIASRGRDPSAAAAGTTARRLATLAFALALGQVAVAAAMMAHAFVPGFRAAHLALGASLWTALAALDRETHRGSPDGSLDVAAVGFRGPAWRPEAPRSSEGVRPAPALSQGGLAVECRAEPAPLAGSRASAGARALGAGEGL